jgi:hypothetical protein
MYHLVHTKGLPCGMVCRALGIDAFDVQESEIGL